MTQKIEITFGSKNILKKIYNKYPERHLSIFKSMNNYNQYQIIDESNKTPIFDNAIQYIIIYQKHINNISNFINYLYFNLDENDQKVFDSNIKEIIDDTMKLNINSISILKETSGKKQLIVMTKWNNAYDFNRWFNKSNIKSLSNMSLNYKKE